jgi:hypothetical protein
MFLHGNENEGHPHRIGTLLRCLLIAHSIPQEYL